MCDYAKKIVDTEAFAKYSAAPKTTNTKLTSSRRSNASIPPFEVRSGCIHIGGGFIPPHVYAASMRPKKKEEVIVGSPPWKRRDLTRARWRYDAQFR